MEYYRLGELVYFAAGINPTRAGREVLFYDQSSFDEDFTHVDELFFTQALVRDEQALLQGDIVISNALRLATVVSQKNAGKIPTLNFIRVDIGERLNPFYFLYIFNSYKKVQRQKEREIQGNGLTLRIPLKALRNIKIPVPDLAEQEKIGEIYRQMLLLQAKLKEYNQLLETAVQTSIEQTLRSQENG